MLATETVKDKRILSVGLCVAFVNTVRLWVSFADLLLGIFIQAAVADADLSGVGCGKYLFVCARIKKGEADPDFELLDEGIESITGCSPVTCGGES